MPKSKVLMLLSALVLCGACTSQPSPQGVDHQAEEQRIRELTQEWYDAENRKDIETIMGFVADGVAVQFPGMPLVEGKNALRDALTPFLESLVSITGGPMTIVVSDEGDIAYHYGTSTVTIEGSDGEVEDPQKYLFVWRKIDGEWKVVAGSSSSDVLM